MSNYTDPWMTILSDLRLHLTNATFDYILRNTYLMERRNATWLIACMKHQRPWLEGRVKPLITSAITERFSPPDDVIFYGPKAQFFWQVGRDLGLAVVEATDILRAAGYQEFDERQWAELWKVLEPHATRPLTLREHESDQS